MNKIYQLLLLLLMSAPLFAMELPKGEENRGIKREYEDLPELVEDTQAEKKPRVEDETTPMEEDKILEWHNIDTEDKLNEAWDFLKETQQITSSSVSATQTVNTQSTATFQDLIADIIAIIITKLENSESEPTQLSDVGHALHNFFRVNKLFKKRYLDDVEFTGKLIQRLANRYSSNIITAAMALHTKGAKLWLEQHYLPSLPNRYMELACRYTIAVDAGKEQEAHFLLAIDHTLINMHVPRILPQKNASLFFAAKSGMVSIIKKVIRAREKVNQLIDMTILNDKKLFGTSLNGFISPLMLAAEQGHVGVIQELLKAGAFRHYSDIRGRTALMIAIEKNHKLAAECLIKGDDALSMQAKNGDTALMKSIEGIHDSITQALIESPSGLNTPNSMGITPLMRAAQKGNFTAVQLLLNAGANAAQTNNKLRGHKVTALDYAKTSLCPSAIKEKIIELLRDADKK